MRSVRVLSLFDGISCGRVAFERAGIPVEFYMSSEIDKYAMKVSNKNWPNIIQMGDVMHVRKLAETGFFGHIDYLIGGSPCQGFSFAGDQLAFDDPRSVLFFEFVAILQILRKRNPNIKFLLENVKMKKQSLDIISMFVGVQPVRINSALVSAQNRDRYYWANWSIAQPEDRGIFLRDIIEDGEVDRDKSYCIDANYYKGGSLKNYLEKSRRQIVLSPRKIVNVNPSGNGMNGWVYDIDAKSPTVTTNKGEGSKIAFHSGEKRLMVKQRPRGFNLGYDKPLEKFPPLTTCSQEQNISVSEDGIIYRKLTPIECERLQTLPDGYTDCVSNTQRYKCLGNGWTVEVIAHILRGSVS